MSEGRRDGVCGRNKYHHFLPLLSSLLPVFHWLTVNLVVHPHMNQSREEWRLNQERGWQLVKNNQNDDIPSFSLLNVRFLKCSLIKFQRETRLAQWITIVLLCVPFFFAGFWPASELPTLEELFSHFQKQFWKEEEGWGLRVWPRPCMEFWKDIFYSELVEAN